MQGRLIQSDSVSTDPGDNLQTSTLKMHRTVKYIPRRQSLHGCPFHIANLRSIVIAERVMHEAAVVPYHQIILLPCVAIAELRACGMAAQELDQGLALFRGHAYKLYDFWILTD